MINQHIVSDSTTSKVLDEVLTVATLVAFAKVQRKSDRVRVKEIETAK